MIKIIHVFVTPQMTGCQQVIYDILRNLPCDYEKYIMCSGPVSAEFRSLFEKHGISVIESKYLCRDISFKDLLALFELFFFFRKNKFDIIHTNSTKPGVIARIAAKISGNKNVIHTVHGISFHPYLSRPKRMLFYFLELLSCVFGSINITVNKFYLKFYPRFIIKSSCIYNGVDFACLDANSKTKNRINKQVCVAFLARLDVQKAPLTYIEIVNKLVHDYKFENVRFILAGNGELMPQCIKLIEEYSLTKYIDVLGWVKNKSDFFNEVDILVQPSYWEAFGLNIVEAAHFSIPTVASNVEGLPEVIINEKTGFTCDVDDINDFSKKIALLINDPHLLSKMGDNAKKHVHAKFNITDMVDNYIKLYENVINKR
ncbi:glycosyltransferase family 4 protein [Escherichia albertii]|uniref:Glycosyltransferase family 1 protein n=1 Tax=Escherichia albertii TaxID=208962 RepID=A0A5A4U9P2_ESCAL|nr:glycosyltransferase family 4 protein [Escherichia albertii]MCZ9036184.1 glycosyltransferase family 4 protein [Escherichia albertii]BBM63188.1 glycosyltransferase family 1 protein [Escherichia albertii]